MIFIMINVDLILRVLKNLIDLSIESKISIIFERSSKI